VRWPHATLDLSQFSAFTIVPTLLIGAVVAGIAEEAGFRGYMQGPLERRYGPAIAITVTSVIFGLAHLSHGLFLPAILFDIAWGALFGLLTYLSGSILPAIILHICADALEFFLVWRLAPRTPAPLIWQAGANPAFWTNCALAVLLGAAAAWAFSRLAKHPLHNYRSE
jgi:membrane protease YdiL (CAAX protease family)